MLASVLPSQNSLRGEKLGTVFKMYGKQTTHSLVQKIKAETYNNLKPGRKAGESFFEKLGHPKVPIYTGEYRSYSYAQNRMCAQKRPEKTIGFHLC